MNSNLYKESTISIFSTYSAKGMHPEHNELQMTYIKALTTMKGAADDYRKAGYNVTVIRKYGSGLAECPTMFTATKRTRYGKEYHHYEIEIQ